MEDGAARRKSLLGEAFKLGLTYLLLSALLYGVSAVFSGSKPQATGAEGFVGHSGLVILVSGVLSFSIMSMAVWYFRSARMIYNIVGCFLISALVSTADFFITREVYELLFIGDNLDLSISSNINDLFICWAGFFGWSCVFLTLLYSFDVLDRERRLAAVREEALSAQMRALRYQVNPHFLFNTLNSIAGLIEGGAATRAERMVLSLSRFLRTTLTLDPFNDVRLSEELALQQEYLEIELERFSDRMSVHMDVPEDVRSALVPSLILQPLIENAVKHGVGAMVGKVNIALIARREADRLKVVVENDMPVDAVSPKPEGMGVGLRNVSERLRARFHGDGRLVAGPGEAGVYRATLDMPWRVG